MLGDESKSATKSKPVFSKKAGGVEVAIWENPQKDKSGNEFKSFSISMKRSYKDGDDWKDTTSLRPNDIPKARMLLAMAYEALVLKDDKKN